MHVKWLIAIAARFNLAPQAWHLQPSLARRVDRVGYSIQDPAAAILVGQSPRSTPFKAAGTMIEVPRNGDVTLTCSRHARNP
jgi:hypothetical protein